MLGINSITLWRRRKRYGLKALPPKNGSPEAPWERYQGGLSLGFGGLLLILVLVSALSVVVLTRYSRVLPAGLSREL